MDDTSFLPANAALRGYLDAIQPSPELFLTYYDFLPDKSVAVTTWTRATFWDLTMRAVALIQRVMPPAAGGSGEGFLKGQRMVHYVSGNLAEDVALRLASVFLGTVPVTINWQADIEAQVHYKITSTDAKVVFVDKRTPDVDKLRATFPGVPIVNVDDIHTTAPVSNADLVARLRAAAAGGMLPTVDDVRCIIFTSGTTGNPKGVELSYANYACNRRTFESFLDLEDPAVTFEPVVVNPLHHTNSTSVTDWALRRPGSRVHLLERYATPYWAIVAAVATQTPYAPVSGAAGGSLTASDARALCATAAAAAGGRRMVCPLVSRHIDFLESLVEGAGAGTGFGVDPAALKECLATVVLLLGSAPVGPTTTRRIMKYAGRLPTVRFGSTETTLQVAGVPLSLSDDATMAAFQAGWDHTHNGEPCQGFYIGREHAGHTEVAVVRSVSREDPDNYLQPCAEGQPGYLVTRGGHVMRSYVGQPALSLEAVSAAGEGAPGSLALAHAHAAYGSGAGWYLKLGDIGYYLHPRGTGHGNGDGNGDRAATARDLYWQSRDSHMLIRGGANYAFEQVTAELSAFLAQRYPALAPVNGAPAFAVAVCGLRVASEHEDECCVLLELLSDAAKAAEGEVVATFAAAAKGPGGVSKGAKPDRVAVGTIPMVLSKGIVSVPEMVKWWKARVTEEKEEEGKEGEEMKSAKKPRTA